MKVVGAVSPFELEDFDFAIGELMAARSASHLALAGSANLRFTQRELIVIDDCELGVLAPEFADADGWVSR